ncbi:MAG: trypsin-like serine peptidase, partial [Bdellovibrionota bacterium]
AHCLFDDRTGEFSGGTYRFFSAYVTRFWWGTRDPDHERGQDWAIGRLDRPLGNSRGWLGIKELDLSQDLMDPKYYMGAFEPDFDRAKVMAWEGGCQFTAMHEADSTVLHNCDGTRGSSGAPIFYYEDVQNPGTSNYMVALQVGEYRDGGEASLIGIPYTDAHANVAVPVSAFHWKLTELKAAAP